MNTTKDKIRARIKAKLALERAAKIKTLADQAAISIEVHYYKALESNRPDDWLKAHKASEKIIADALKAL